MGEAWSLSKFVAESNRIEGIPLTRQHEIDAHAAFLSLRRVTVADLSAFVSVIQPHAKLRSRAGMNVRVGPHVAPPGGPGIVAELEALLQRANTMRSDRDAHDVHMAYETLHPFMDGNGRSGRALWLWMHRGCAPLGFLHHWYYETLRFSRPSPKDAP